MAQSASKLREHPYVARTSGTCGGCARIDGTRIPVWLVVSSVLRGGMSPDEFVEAYPSVGLEHVYDALSYYYDHRAEIDADLRDQDSAWRKQSRRTSR